MNKDIELAWAAGFFDGEGSVGCYHKVHRNTMEIRIHIAQTDPYVLWRFYDAVGFGNVTGPYTRNPKHSPQWAYQLGRLSEIKSVFLLLEPYLSPVKIEQFVKAIDVKVLAN